MLTGLTINEVLPAGFLPRAASNKEKAYQILIIADKNTTAQREKVG